MSRDLIDKFNSLPIPIKKGELLFAAVPVENGSPHRIGKDSNGCPCILIAVKSGKRDVFPNTVLQNISVIYDLYCQVSHDSLIEDGMFSIMTFTGDEDSLRKSFLRFCDVILDLLGNEPDKKTVATALDRCVKLFKNISKPPKKAINGLWSELFFITISNNTEKLVEAWHVNAEDRCDFNLGKIRYEIKSSSKRIREHYFSQEQLEAAIGIEIIIVSLFTESSDTGKSIGDLVDEIKVKIGNNPRLIEKVMALCYEVLGNSLDESYNLRFDVELARTSITAYEAEIVPHIKNSNIPLEVSDIKYKVNLTRIKGNRSLLPIKFE